MFSSEARATEASLKRAERYLKRVQRTEGFDKSEGEEGKTSGVTFAAYDPAPALWADDDEVGVGGVSLPPVSLLTSSPAEVKQHYPDAPWRKATAGTASALGSKRTRELPAPLSSQAPANKAMAESTNEAVTPMACFVDSFEKVNHAGRSFLEPPPVLVQLAPQLEAKPCVPPRTLKGAFRAPPQQQQQQGVATLEKGSHGIQQLCWAPARYAHLLLSADLGGGARLWSAESRQCIATYTAHTQPVKSLAVTSDAAVFSTGSVDGTVALWDTERGERTAVLVNEGGLPVTQHAHHPSQEDALLLVALDQKVVLYDVRDSTRRIQREYAGHRGSILSLALLSGGSKFLTTAEDRTLRTWDFRIPVQITQVADPSMHAISHVAQHPTSPEFLAAQSLDNKVIVFRHEGAGKVRRLRQKEFSGHHIAGTRCHLSFSPDGAFISSGDIKGALYVWRWATGELVKSFPAHAQMLTSHLWHPLERSRVVTASWDGLIKNWV